jgi:DNA-binding FrmR family transcriptional regulator
MSTPNERNEDAIRVARDRVELLNRLRRAEGQVRGIQRMVEAGEGCLKIAAQFSAVRKALDSTYIHMSMCYLKQHIQAAETAEPNTSPDMETALANFTTLLSRLR